MAGTVTVFGGTGFLGRRVVLHLCDKGFSVRVASRHPERGREHFGRDAAQLRLVRADIHDDGSVAEAMRLRTTRFDENGPAALSRARLLIGDQGLGRETMKRS